MKKLILTTEQLFFAIEIFRSFHTDPAKLEALQPKISISTVVCGLAWVKSGSIAQFLLSNREDLMSQLREFPWDVSEAVDEISSSMPLNPGQEQRNREFFERIASGEINEEMLKNVATLQSAT